MGPTGLGVLFESVKQDGGGLPVKRQGCVVVSGTVIKLDQ